MGALCPVIHAQSRLTGTSPGAFLAHSISRGDAGVRKRIQSPHGNVFGALCLFHFRLIFRTITAIPNLRHPIWIIVLSDSQSRCGCLFLAVQRFAHCSRRLEDLGALGSAFRCRRFLVRFIFGFGGAVGAFGPVGRFMTIAEIEMGVMRYSRLLEKRRLPRRFLSGIYKSAMTAAVENQYSASTSIINYTRRPLSSVN